MSVPAPGLYTYIKSWKKKLYKIRLQRDVFETCSEWPKWQDVPCGYKNFVPKRLSAPALGLNTCTRSWIKSDLKDMFLKLATKRWQDSSVNIKILSPGGCLPLPQGYIHVKNHEKNRIKWDFKEIFFKLATNDWSDNMFLLTSNFRPQGVVSPCPGAIYVYKVMKKIV